VETLEDVRLRFSRDAGVNVSSTIRAAAAPARAQAISEKRTAWSGNHPRERRDYCGQSKASGKLTP
jgi:hypothetical protein